jgi:hypothetical protein
MSKPVTLSAVPEATEVTTIRTLRKGRCSNLSGNATLSYEVGCSDAHELFICITENSGKGYFGVGHWTSLAAIQKLFSQLAEGASITSYTLHPLFKGMSANNSGFALAVIRDLGLVQPHATELRSYQVADGKTFFEEMQNLMADSTSASTVSKEPAKSQAKKAAA